MHFFRPLFRLSSLLSGNDVPARERVFFSQRDLAKTLEKALEKNQFLHRAYGSHDKDIFSKRTFSANYSASFLLLRWRGLAKPAALRRTASYMLSGKLHCNHVPLRP